jgi:hypothetical protein
MLVLALAWIKMLPAGIGPGAGGAGGVGGVGVGTVWFGKYNNSFESFSVWTQFTV